MRQLCWLHRASHLQFDWTPGCVTLTQAAALVLPVLAAMALRGAGVALVLAAALITALFWEILFALIRGRPITGHGLTTALILAVMIPLTVPLWQIGVAVSLGVVLAELIFGGGGFGFLNAAVASLAFLSFSFPGVMLVGNEPWVAAASLPGAAVLLALGLISWRVLVAAAVFVLGITAFQGEVLAPLETAAALTFGLVFLACDPIGAASTNPGRWLYGALVAGLIVVFGGSGATLSTNALVFAVLLASIFAPLLDHLVVLANAWRRNKRAERLHG